MDTNSRILIQEYLNIMTIILGKSQKQLKGKRVKSSKAKLTKNIKSSFSM